MAASTSLALPDFQPAIAAKGVSVTYSNGHTALVDASFELKSGTICALVGVNGSGKSTLFKAIMGDIKPDAGEVLLCGMPAAKALGKNAVSYVPQSEDVDWNFPVLVEDVVMMGRYGHMNFLRIASANDRLKVDEALERVGMTEYRKRQIGELSGGQKKRVFLARSLAQESPLILLDEPFTGVDVKTEAAIIELLREMRDQGRVILVSTHNLGSVPEFCDQVVLLDRTVIAAGKTKETFTQKNLERTFGGVLRHFTLEGEELHDDDDPRGVTVLTDDERPLVFYGEENEQAGSDNKPKAKPKRKPRSRAKPAVRRAPKKRPKKKT